MLLTLWGLAGAALYFYFTTFRVYNDAHWTLSCVLVWMWVMMMANWVCAVVVPPLPPRALERARAAVARRSTSTSSSSGVAAGEKDAAGPRSSGPIHGAAVDALRSRTHGEEATGIVGCGAAGGGAPRASMPAGQPAGVRRALLCRACGVRSNELDHHCPFTGSCVGDWNFRFFFYAMVYGWLGVATAAVVSWPGFVQCAWRAGQDDDGSAVQARCDLVFGDSGLSLAFVAVILLLLCGGSLFALHSVLLLADLRTYELLRAFRGCGDEVGIRSLGELVGRYVPCAC